MRSIHFKSYGLNPEMKITILVIEAKHFIVVIKDISTEGLLQNNKCCCNFKGSEYPESIFPKTLP